MGILLSACGGGSSDSSAGGDETPSPTPTPTASAATEAQLASVIAGYQRDWREVIRNASDCRFDLAMQDSGGIAKAARLSCYTDEITIGLTAASALEELAAMSAPDSMTALVDETTAALQGVAGVDLETVCGPAMSEIRGDKKCRTALGTRMWAYDDLDTALDRWSPYL